MPLSLLCGMCWIPHFGLASSMPITRNGLAGTSQQGSADGSPKVRYINREAAEHESPRCDCVPRPG